MAVYSGKSTAGLDLIAKRGVTRREVELIYDEICPVTIGEIKFVSRKENLADKGLVRSGGVWSWDGTTDFDGWVYPDGSSFSASDFPDAAAEYGISGGAFRVPNLHGSFFKGSTSGLRDVAQKTGLQRHNHSLTNEAGVPVQFQLKNGFVFCAAGNYGSARTQTYYTHPATKYARYNSKGELTAVVDISAQYGIKGVGAYPAVSIISAGVECEPNYDPDNPSMEYTVPTFHSGSVNYTAKRGSSGACMPLPFDMTLKLSDVAAWFEGGKTEGPTQNASYPYAVGSGRFVPESVNILTMIYIGKKLA